MIRIVKTPKFIQRGFPGLIWNIPNDERAIFLTFDDGPHPEITPWVLKLLNEHQVPATFFCLGKHVEQYSEIFEAIKADYHDIGNHGYDHLNGWKTKSTKYVQNAEKANRLIDSKFFRPPYGKITPVQFNAIKEHHNIIMFDVISYDFDEALTPNECIDNVLKNMQSGSILVMHDSVKAWKNLKDSLEHIIIKLKASGFVFKKISDFIDKDFPR